MPAKRTALIEHDGKRLTAEEWAAATGIPAGTILSRIRRLKWTAARALTTPPDGRFSPTAKARPAPPVKPPPPLKEGPDGRAWCRWRTGGGGRETRYFGTYGSPEATTAYARFTAAWAEAGGKPPAVAPAALSVAGLVARFLDHAEGYYVKHGKPTSDQHIQRAAFAALNDLFGDTPAADFAPADLRTLKGVWVRAGKARPTVNAYARRVKLAFKWAASHSLIPAAVYDSLRLVESEAKGRTKAREPKRKLSVPVDVVEKTIPHLHADPARRRVLAAMVRTQLYGGMRPGEVCAMRPGDLDTTRPRVWVYDVGKVSKTLHLDKERVVYLGPKARAELSPFLAECPPTRPVFHFAARRKGGGGFVRVTVAAYTRFVKAACEKAGVTRWTPHRLRATWATLVRDHFGSEAAGAAGIGDTMETARRHYLDPEAAAAERAAAELG